MVEWYILRDSGQTEDDSRIYTVRDTEGMIDKMLANAIWGIEAIRDVDEYMDKLFTDTKWTIELGGFEDYDRRTGEDIA